MYVNGSVGGQISAYSCLAPKLCLFFRMDPKIVHTALYVSTLGFPLNLLPLDFHSWDKLLLLTNLDHYLTFHWLKIKNWNYFSGWKHNQEISQMSDCVLKDIWFSYFVMMYFKILTKVKVYYRYLHCSLFIPVLFLSLICIKLSYILFLSFFSI